MTPANAEVPDSVLRTLKGIFSEMLAPDIVEEVRAKGEEPWEGDIFLKITIVFKRPSGKKGIPDIRKMLNFWDRVRPVLEEAGDTRWPYYSMVTKKEMLEMEQQGWELFDEPA